MIKRSYILKRKFDIEEIKNLAVEVKQDKVNVMVTNTFNDEIVDGIFADILSQLNLKSNSEAWVLVTGVLQRGGSNLKAGNAISYTLGDKTLSSHDLQKIVKKHAKNATCRQLARTIASDVAAVALELNIPGDLHAQMRYEYPDLTETDAVWCSNFQTTNPQCPENVRNWLVENYKARFNK